MRGPCCGGHAESAVSSLGGVVGFCDDVFYFFAINQMVVCVYVRVGVCVCVVCGLFSTPALISPG